MRRARRLIPASVLFALLGAGALPAVSAFRGHEVDLELAMDGRDRAPLRGRALAALELDGAPCAHHAARGPAREAHPPRSLRFAILRALSPPPTPSRV